MAQLRAQIIRVPISKLARDYIINTVHFETDPGAGVGELNYDTLATDTAELFQQQLLPVSGYDRFECRMYNLDDDEPREPRAVKQSTTGAGGTSGPREVALCLSFFSERNLPRRRGRLYLGPWPSAAMAERPSDATMDRVQAIAVGLQAIGGTNIDWSIHSRRDSGPGEDDQEFRKVTDWWCDNEWDTQRRRGQRATFRRTGVTSE